MLRYRHGKVVDLPPGLDPALTESEKKFRNVEDAIQEGLDVLEEWLG